MIACSGGLVTTWGGYHQDRQMTLAGALVYVAALVIRWRVSWDQQ
jgi:hypothetical protein